MSARTPRTSRAVEAERDVGRRCEDHVEPGLSPTFGVRKQLAVLRVLRSGDDRDHARRYVIEAQTMLQERAEEIIGVAAVERAQRIAVRALERPCAAAA